MPLNLRAGPAAIPVPQTEQPELVRGTFGPKNQVPAPYPKYTTGNPDEELSAVAPPGFEHTVKKMKKDKGISNPFALAWYMKNRGFKPAKHENDASYDTQIAAALAELKASRMPTICLQAAAGDSWAMSQCLLNGQMVVAQKKWW